MDSSPGTVAHETAHAIEDNNPSVLKAAREFLWKRAAGEELQTLRKLTGIKKYKITEKAFKDRWVELGGTAYTGKPYTGGRGDPKSAEDITATEILSTGIERIYKGAAKFLAQDPEYFMFTLKTLRGL